MQKDREHIGEIFIFGEAILWGLFPVITSIAVTQVSPLAALFFSTLFATFFFALVISFKKNWSQVMSGKGLKDAVFAAFFIGVLYYVLLFIGLKHTNSGNASIISMSETLTSYLFFHVWRKEYFPRIHILGAICIALAVGVVLVPHFTTLRSGDGLILFAAFIAPFGNFFMQRARKQTSTETIMFVRSMMSTAVVGILALITRVSFSSISTGNMLIYVALNGFFLLGLSKIFWVEGIHRITVTKANALSSISPVVTLLFSWMLQHAVPTLWQVAALVPLLIGIRLLGKSATASSQTALATPE